MLREVVERLASERVHLAVAAGVAVATAVITGALLVGDSVRGSLHDLVLERLGSIAGVVVAEQPFREELATEIEGRDLGPGVQGVAPLLLVPGSMSSTRGEQTTQATQLSILGVTEEFWKFGEDEVAKPTSGDGAILSQSIADELHVSVGDEVLLRVAVPSNIPADSTLGEKADASTVRRLTVAAIDNSGIARFGLHPSQLEPRNVFVPLATMQRLLKIPGKANVIAVGSKDSSLLLPLQPQLADFGLQLEEVDIGDPPAIRFGQLSAERLVLTPYLVKTVEKLFAGVKPQAVVTYLANSIQLGEKKIPYSTVTGVDSTAELGPLRNAEGEPILLGEHEIALNDWAAEQLGAQVGDTLTISYYEPETTHGELIERATDPLTIKVIAPLHTDEGQPTAVADQHFTPELPGVTDERSISDWDLPFPLIEKISQADEKYWDDYRTTPKAFVSLALAKQLWSTRWGATSALRLPITEAVTVEKIKAKLTAAIDPAALGMKWLPVKVQGLAAARGTTSFEGLFLGFSFFLMASAIMLIALLFRLGAEGRAAEVGLLAALGWNTQRVRRMWLAEAAVVAVVGATLGAGVGIGYAALMIHGLTTWWVAATVSPFLELHVNPLSLTLGFACGVIVSLITIARSLQKLTRLEPRQLLAGDTSDPNDNAPVLPQRRKRLLPAALLFAASVVGLVAMFAGLRDEAQAGAFFGSGALVLAGILIWLRDKLRQPTLAVPRGLSLVGLALRNARRNPSRTILSVALAAVASFLIVALSAFRLAPTSGGTGGFDLIASADLPIHFDLNSPTGREELGFSADEEHLFAGADVCSFRVRGGEDASCLNLYQTTQPRVVGVPNSFDRAGHEFAWAALQNPPPQYPGEGLGEGHSETLQIESEQHSPWKLLEHSLGTDSQSLPIVPVVLDKNTATYSLHLAGIGARFTIRDSFDNPVTLEVVGLLAGSILQGNVLMSETNFLRLYPDAAGQKLFLIRAGGTATMDLAPLLETRLVDYGFDAVSTTQRLADFLAVQNTYLTTFQSLGALGLLLGTVGLAVAQLRSVVERRSELALLRSTGFRRARLAELVLGENATLLLAGLGCGCLAALVATLPHWALHEANIPWGTLLALLGTVVVLGIAAGWMAVRAAIATPLIAALRGE